MCDAVRVHVCERTRPMAHVYGVDTLRFAVTEIECCVPVSALHRIDTFRGDTRNRHNAQLPQGDARRQYRITLGEFRYCGLLRCDTKGKELNETVVVCLGT